MNKCIYKGVDIFNPIDGKLKYFIDAFVKIYGEQYRPAIEFRLNNAKYYFLGGKFSNIILKYRELEKEELAKVDATPSLTPSLKKFKKTNIHERYNHIIKIFEDTQKEIDIITYKYSYAVDKMLINYINALRKDKNLEPLTESQARIFASTYLDILSIGKHKLTSRKNILSKQKKDDLLELFKAIGYNERNIESCLRNKQLLNNVFNQYLIQQINSLNSSKSSELNKINFCVSDLNYHLNNLNIYGGADVYAKTGAQYINNKTQNSAFVINCVTMDSKFTTLCFCKNALELNLEDLTHEMGHIIDSFVVESNKEEFFYRIGFEIQYCNMSGYYNEKFNEKYNNREFELFNEMVNEYIIQKVANEIKKTGKTFVFAERKKDQKSKYEFGFEIFENFLEKYQDKLIELKLTFDKNEKTFEYFGEKNFRRIAKITHEYITLRNELNHRYINGDLNAQEEIETLKAKAKAELAEVERKINKHIEKNENSNKKQEKNIEK